MVFHQNLANKKKLILQLLRNNSISIFIPNMSNSKKGSKKNLTANVAESQEEKLTPIKKETNVWN